MLSNDKIHCDPVIYPPFKKQNIERHIPVKSLPFPRIQLPYFLLVVEETEPVSTTNELNQLSFIDTTNTNGHMHANNHFSLPATSTAPSKPAFIPTFANPPMPMSNNIYTNENLSSNFWLTNSVPVVPEPIVEQTETIPSSQPPSINDAFDSNLTALIQSNNPTNPFSPYGYSMAAQAQSPNINHRQPAIFTPKRGTNPFDDDLIRRWTRIFDQKLYFC